MIGCIVCADVGVGLLAHVQTVITLKQGRTLKPRRVVLTLLVGQLALRARLARPVTGLPCRSDAGSENLRLNFFDHAHFVFYILVGRQLQTAPERRRFGLTHGRRLTSTRRNDFDATSGSSLRRGLFARFVASCRRWSSRPRPLTAQTFVRAARRRTAVERVSIAADALSAAISSLLEKGRSLELTGRWADALSHYEEALHEYPEDRTLQARFDVARLHYSLEQRYDDRSFRESLRTLRPQQALDQYSDLLEQDRRPLLHDSAVAGHQPPRRDGDGHRAGERGLLAQPRRSRSRPAGRTAAGRDVAASRPLRDSLVATTRRPSPRKSPGSANQRIGLSETATLLEFTAAAAGGLDHYSAFLTADQLRDIYSQIEGNFVGPGRRAEGRQRGAVDRARHSAQPGREGRHPRRRSHHGRRRPGRPAPLSTDEAASLLTGAEGSLVPVTRRVARPGAARAHGSPGEHVEVPSLEDVKIVDPANGRGVPPHSGVPEDDRRRPGRRPVGPASPGHAKPDHRPPRQPGRPADGERRGGRQVHRRRRHRLDPRPQRAGKFQLPRPPARHMARAAGRADRRRQRERERDLRRRDQGRGRGKIVGTRSYGKGSVQGIFPLGKNGAGARLTTAKFFSPLGHPISNVGITPDIDARRATQVATGAEPAGTNTTSPSAPTGGDGSASLANSAAPGGAPPTRSLSASRSRLEIAIDAARKEPVPPNFKRLYFSSPSPSGRRAFAQ